MKVLIATTSVVALVATMSLAIAQTPKGGEGQKEMSPPAAKEAAPSDRDSPKSGERKETTDNKGAQEKGDSKDAGKKQASDKEKADKRSTADKDKSAGNEKSAADKDATNDAAGKDGKGTSRSASLNQEQRTKVQSSFAKHKRQSIKVDFTVNVGVAVPRRVQLYAIPQDIVVIVPAYRRYRYFVVDNRIVIVDPSTYEIVDIIIIA
jgi:hypothetical protein